MNNNYKIVFAIIITCSLVKLAMWNKPIFDGAGGKQLYTALMAQNLIRSDYNPVKLYTKLIVNKEKTHLIPLIRVPEFPLYHYLAIIVSKVFNFELGNAGRLVSILCFAGSACYFWAFLSLLLPRFSALIALFLYCFFPVTLTFTKTFQGESLMMLCLMGAIYNFLVWYERDKTKNLIFTLFFCSLGFVVKQYILYIYLPFLWFLIQKYHYHLFRKKVTYTFLVPLIPFTIWMYFSYVENAKLPYADWELSSWVLGEVFNYNWYRDLLTMQIQSYTPLFFTACIFGIFLKKNSNLEFFLYVWIVSVGIFFFLVAHKATHDYYQLHQAPIVAYFSGKFLGNLYLTDWFKKNITQEKIYLGICGFLVFIILVGYSNSGFLIPKHMTPDLIKWGHKIEKMTKEDDILIAGYGDGVLFYSNRLGVMLKEPSIEKLELFRKLGASYFVQGKRSYSITLGNSAFKSYLLDNYIVKDMKDGEYAIFDLREKIKKDTINKL